MIETRQNAKLLSASLTFVNSPPPKGGGFGLRLKAGSVRPSADMAATHVTLKLSSGSGGAWFLMYSTHMSSVTLPLLTTQ
jgi:hypothetical protein